MNKFGKIACLSLGAVLSLGIACACGETGGGGGDKPTGKNVTLVVWCPEADQAFAKQVAEEFKAAHPEKSYTFQWGVQGENDAATKVLTDVENAPDVFSFASDQINKLIVGDALARIGGDRLNRIKEQNTAEAVDAATVTVNGEDQTYAFPYTDNTFFLYYNKAKLSEEDVKTLDGILAKCGPKEQFGYPMNDGWYNSAFFFGKGLGYDVEFSDQLAEVSVDTDFGSAEGQKVVEAMWSYVNNPKVKADSDDSKLTSGFQSGEIIAGVSGIWNKTSIQKYLGDNFGVAKLPTYTLEGEQVQLKAFAGYKLFGVSKHSPNLVDAQEFAEFYTNKENQIKHFEARGFLPTNKEAQTDSRITSDACALAIKSQLAFSKTQKGVPSTLWTPLQGLGDAMITAAGKGQTPDLAKELKAAVASIKKEAK